MHFGRVPTAAVVAVLCAAAITIVSAQNVVARTDSNTVSAGQAVVVTVRAPAGAPIAVTATGPGMVAPVQAVGTGADQRVTIGPFSQTGAYTIRVASGGQQAVVPMNVSFPQSEQAPAATGNAGASYRSAADALVAAINSARTGLNQISGSQPTVEESKRAIDALQQQLADIRARANETGNTLDGYGTLLSQETNASRAVKDEFSRISNELSQLLNEQGRQARQFGHDAETPHEDPCQAAVAASTALRGAQAMLASMQNGGSDAARRQRVAPGGGADWARSTVTGGRPLRGDGTAQSSAAAWDALKPQLDAMMNSGAASSYSDAARQIDRAAGPNGLGGFESHTCQKYTGEWSGTTDVQAIDKGIPYYGLQNTWTAHVEVVAARSTVTPGAEQPLRGTITGHADNFKVVNQLRSLYARQPAQSIQYLTSDPTPAQTASAMFVASVEGFIRGNQMTLKVLPGGVDYSGRVTGKLAAIVIPMASPVPLVQTFDIVFQGGNWQLSRAIGPNGLTERPLPIINSGDKRLVQAEFPRDLNSDGARGHFTIKMRLCSGCD